MDSEILKTIREKGLLLERDVFDLVESFHDSGKAREFLENLERYSGQKMITRGVINKNVEFVQGFVKKLGDERQSVEKVIVKMGVTLEVEKTNEIVSAEKSAQELKSVDGNKLGRQKSDSYEIVNCDTGNDKKLELGDFVGHFRARYQELQRILMNRPDLQSELRSINKISSDRQQISLIGIVTEKRITKNKNLILKLEDMTGTISGLVKEETKELFEKASEIQLDDVIAVKASGSRDIVFIHDMFWPDSFVQERVNFNEDVRIAFLSDIHCGSIMHLSESFQKFLDWINSDDLEAKKIKYLFFVGDNIDGVGIFPGQEDVLKIKSSEEQYKLLATYLRRIPERITMFMCPGQHDAVRVAEPQPILDKKYASPLYDIPNLNLVTNPAYVKLKEGDKVLKVLMYHGASSHMFVNEVKELREINAHKCPAKIMKHMLRRRHLAPSHGVSPHIVYNPNGKDDQLVISEVPDVMCTGENHRLDTDTYNGVQIICGSCWQSTTPFEEKVGHVPDPCKVPVLNLKTRDLKVFDFGSDMSNGN
jgi:DNA polymerase II small subunit